MNDTRAADLRQTSFRAAYRRAVDWLVSRQHANGMWALSLASGVTIPSASLTAIALESLGSGPERDACADVLDRGGAWILTQQNEDGSFGDGVGNAFYRPYCSAYVLGCLATLDRDRYAEPIRRTVEYLKNHQCKEGIERGGIGYGMKEPFPDPSDPDTAYIRKYAAMSPTAIAALAFHKAGVPKDDEFWSLVIEFCRSLHDSRAINRREEILRLLDDAGYCLSDGGGLVNTLLVFKNAPRSPSGTEPREREPIVTSGMVTCLGILTYLAAGLPRDSLEINSAVDWARHNYTVAEHAGIAEVTGAGQKPLYPPEPAKAAQNTDWSGLYNYYRAMARAFDALDLHPLVTADGQTHDWAAELAEELLAHQHADGYWVNQRNPRWQEFDAIMSTGFALSAGSVVLKYVD